MVVNGVKICDNVGCGEREINAYIAMAAKQAGGHVAEITINPAGGDDVQIDYTVKNKFERIRRITGYLVGTIDRWNNAKRSEEKDRVKHD